MYRSNYLAENRALSLESHSVCVCVYVWQFALSFTCALSISIDSVFFVGCYECALAHASQIELLFWQTAQITSTAHNNDNETE